MCSLTWTIWISTLYNFHCKLYSLYQICRLPKVGLHVSYKSCIYIVVTYANVIEAYAQPHFIPITCRSSLHVITHRITIFDMWVTSRWAMDRLNYFLSELNTQGLRIDWMLLWHWAVGCPSTFRFQIISKDLRVRLFWNFTHNTSRWSSCAFWSIWTLPYVWFSNMTYFVVLM